MSFVCCTSSCEEAKKLVKVRRKHKKKGVHIQTDIKTNLSDDYEKNVKEVALGLSLGKGEFMLCAM